MEIKKVILALGTVLALTACGGTSEPTTSQDSTTSGSETTTETTSKEESSEVAVEKFLSSIYGDNAKYGDKVAVTDNAYPNVKGYYVAKDKNGKLLGHVFILEGENTYGTIKISIGINADETIGKVYLIENDQTLPDQVKGYVDGYNSGDRDFDDVKCGATIGATLINTMGKQAQTFVKAEINKRITDFSPYCKEVFGAEVNYIRRNNVIDTTNKTLKEFWTASDKETGKTLGRVYHAELNGNNFMIGVNKGGEYGEENPNAPQTLKGIFWVNSSDKGEGVAANSFIAKLNKGQETLEPNDADNNLIKDIKKVGNESMAHAAKNKITNPVDVTNLLSATFGNDVSYCEKTIVDDPSNPNIVEYWNVKDANRKYVGRAYHMEAPGEHGSVHLVVGVKPDGEQGGKFYKVSTINQIPTFNKGGQDAHDALDSYIVGLNNGTIDINSEDDVENGATGTSSGIRNLCLAAVKHYGANIIADMFLENVYGNKVSYIERTYLTEEHVRAYWNVMDKNNQYIGRVYHVSFTGRHATINALVGVNPAGQFIKLHLINKANGEYGDKLQAYVDSLNNGDATLDDDISNGATASSSAVRDIAKEALAHYKANPILPLLADMTYVSSLFEAGVTLNDHRRVSGEGYENVVEYWTVKDADGKPIAGAYHCALPGKHAIMEITVSVYPETVNYKTTAKLGKVKLLNKAPNEYGDILQSYVDGLNDGSIDINDDVHNGATSSSTGVQGMVKQAMAHLEANSLDKGMDLTAALKNTFGENANYGNAIKLTSVAYDNLLECWDVKDAEGNVLGRVYHGAFPGTHGVLHALIAINNDGTLKTIYWANCPIGVPGIPPHVEKYGKLALEWITKINNGEIKLSDDVHSGATGTTSGIIYLAIQALDHYALNK